MAEPGAGAGALGSRHGETGCLKVLAWLWVLWPLAGVAGQAVCNGGECSAAVAVNLKIVIPERLRLRVEDDRTVHRTFNNDKLSPVYTVGETGVVTVSSP